LEAACGQINGLVSKVIKKAKGKPSSAGKPQSRLLYKPTENDTAAPGACAHFANGAGPHCEPYHPVQASHGYDAMVEADTKTRDVRGVLSGHPEALRREFRGCHLRGILLLRRRDAHDRHRGFRTSGVAGTHTQSVRRRAGRIGRSSSDRTRWSSCTGVL